MRQDGDKHNAGVARSPSKLPKASLPAAWTTALPAREKCGVKAIRPIPRDRRSRFLLPV